MPLLRRIARTLVGALTLFALAVSASVLVSSSRNILILFRMFDFHDALEMWYFGSRFTSPLWLPLLILLVSAGGLAWVVKE